MYDRRDFVPFVAALRRGCELATTTLCTSTCGSLVDRMDGVRLAPPSIPPAVEIPLDACSKLPVTEENVFAALTEPVRTTAVATPARTGDAQGIPADVVRGLIEAVLSASICRCGREVAGTDNLSSGGKGCPTHGLTAVSWERVLQSEADHGCAADTVDVRRGGQERRRTVASGFARRRECLVETLRVLAEACRWSHTRQQLARQSRGGGGGIAKALCLLCDALCTGVTELRRRQQGPFNRSNIAGDANAHRYDIYCLSLTVWRRVFLCLMFCRVPIVS